MKFKEMNYQRVDVEQVENQMNEIRKRFQEAKSGEEQFEIHKEYYKIMDDVSTMSTIAHIRHDVDTTDEFYNKEQDFYDEVGPQLDNLVVKYQKLLWESPYRSYLEEKIGKVAFKNIELGLKSFDESIISLMQEENTLTTKYDKLIASAEIEWDGEILNVSLLRPYLTHVDREIRKKAWEKLTEFFDGIAEELDTIYDELVKNRTKQAKELGYDNYLQLGYYRMKRNSYDKTMVENLRKQIKEVFVPFVSELHEKRRKRLGLEQLSFVDEGVYFLQGNPEPIGTPEEIMENGLKMYEELSPETREFFDFMMKNELFDVLGRKTKKAGG